MHSLKSRSYVNFILSTVTVLTLVSPLLFHLLKVFYTDDLDEMINYRVRVFEVNQLPLLSHIDVDSWNHFNPDLQIIEFDENLKVNSPHQITLHEEGLDEPNTYRAIYQPILINGEKHLIHSRIPMISQADLIHMIASQLAVEFFFIILGLFIVYIIFSREISTPFYNTLQTLSKFQVYGKSVPEFGKTKIIEFKYLNEKLSELMLRSQNSYKRQKEFIENASHELQTPLAVIQSQLDLLLQDPDLTEAQNSIIQSLYTASAHTKRLNKNLLLLAKIDNSQFVAQEEVDLVDKLNNTYQLFTEIANAEEISFSIRSVDELSVKANSTLVDILLNNLFSNAIRYNMPGGKVHIELNKDSLIFYNTSESTPLNEATIFKRFIRKDNSKYGSGLGLSITKEICIFHHWDISYSYEKGYHKFKVSLNS